MVLIMGLYGIEPLHELLRSTNLPKEESGREKFPKNDERI